MDKSSSDEDIGRKGGWLLVNYRGSVENSDEELAPPQSSSHANIPTGLDVVEASVSHPGPLQTEPDISSSLLSSGSWSSGGSTLIGSLPSPTVDQGMRNPLENVEESLAGVPNFPMVKIKRDDSQSLDSFEVLSEGPSDDGGLSLDRRCEDTSDEEETHDEQGLLAPPEVQPKFISDSDSDFIRLSEPAESAPSGVKELGAGSHPHDSVLSSPDQSLDDSQDSLYHHGGSCASNEESDGSPTLPPRPQNAPYEDVRGCQSDEDSDHVRIMSRRWPTEDGGFLLVQRFRKIDPDSISTLSSSMSDFSGFSMLGGSSHQGMLSDTHEEEDEDLSDTESEASISSSYASQETLPVNMTVENLPSALRQYLHQRNDGINSKLSLLAILVLTAGLTLGIGHFVGSSQMVSHHKSLQEGQKYRLRSLQDELVVCMEKRKLASKQLQEQEIEIQGLVTERDAVVLDSMSRNPDDGQRRDPPGECTDSNNMEVCNHCQESELRYSRFCNTLCPLDRNPDHSCTTGRSIKEQSAHPGIQDASCGGSTMAGNEEIEIPLTPDEIALGGGMSGSESGAPVPSHPTTANQVAEEGSDNGNDNAVVDMIATENRPAAQDPIQDRVAHVDVSENIPRKLVSVEAKVSEAFADGSNSIDSQYDLPGIELDCSIQDPSIKGCVKSNSVEENIVSDTGDLDKGCSVGSPTQIPNSQQISVEDSAPGTQEIGSQMQSAAGVAVQTEDDAKWVCIDGVVESCLKWAPKHVLPPMTPISIENDVIDPEFMNAEQTTRVKGVTEVEAKSTVDDAEWVCIDGLQQECSEWVPKSHIPGRAAHNFPKRTAVGLGPSDIKPTSNVSFVNSDSAGESVSSESNATASMEGALHSAWSVLENASHSVFQKNISVSIDNAFQTAIGVVESASRLLQEKVYFQNVTDVMVDMKERMIDWKETMESSLASVQAAAAEEVSKLMDRKTTGNDNNKARGQTKGHGQKSGKKSKKKQKAKKKSKSGGKSISRRKIIGKGGASRKSVIARKGTRSVDDENINKLDLHLQGPSSNLTDIFNSTAESPQQEALNNGTARAPTNTTRVGNADQERSSSMLRPQTTEPIRNSTARDPGKTTKPQRKHSSSSPPKLNIEKVLESLDMSCRGETRCVENHKLDAARLLKEMISYRQWLWEQRFRKDVDEVEDFMEELEEFIDEDHVNDEDIEELKGEFEDMVEDIQKTAKKFFRKQYRRRDSRNDDGERKRRKMNKKNATKEGKKHRAHQGVDRNGLKLSGEFLQGLERNHKTEEGNGDPAFRKNDESGVEESLLGNGLEDSRSRKTQSAGGNEEVQTVLLSVDDLPSVQMENSSSLAPDGDDEVETETESLTITSLPVPDSHQVPLSQEQAESGYANTDQWFFRRARDRNLRRGSDPDGAGWYFKRFQTWEDDRRTGQKKDWYFERGESRESERGCTTQPSLCAWAKDESVITVWEMYKWLTERFSIRENLRTWDLEDQINWFLRKR